MFTVFQDLGTLLITQQLVNQVLEVGIPYGIYKFKKKGKYLLSRLLLSITVELNLFEVDSVMM